MARRKPLADRFWSKVAPGPVGKCWDWRGATTTQGYGYLGATPASALGPRVPATLAHRLSWEIHNGMPIPDDLHVCHKCDRPICVNPSHLFLGTRLDNNRDRNTKGRSGSLPGESNPSAKLSAEQVREIRRRYAGGGVTQLALAEEYGVKQAQVSRIVRGVSYSSA